MKKRKRIYLFIMCLFLLIFGVLIFFLIGRDSEEKKVELQIDSNAKEWTGRQNLPQKGEKAEV